MVGAGLEAAASHAVCAVLEEVWGSDRFSVQCIGGDFSLPGAEKQDLHADVPARDIARQLFLHRDPANPSVTFMELPLPAVKVYFPLVDLDDSTGPPRFLPGSHKRTASEDVPPPEQEPATVLAYCPAGSALLMDQRVWHGGTPNLSEPRPWASTLLRDLLLVLPQGRRAAREPRVPFFGTYYWCYHRGAVRPASLEALPPRVGQLARELLQGPSTAGACARCAAAVSHGRSALPRIGGPPGSWLCL